jgi:hypothetical protein
MAHGPRGSCRRPQIARAVRTLLVVVPHILAQHLFQLALADDQHPVQALPARAAHPAFGVSVRLRAKKGVRITRAPSDSKTVSKLRRNLRSRSWIRGPMLVPRRGLPLPWHRQAVPLPRCRLARPVVDVLLRERRDLPSAQAFFRRADDRRDPTGGHRHRSPSALRQGSPAEPARLAAHSDRPPSSDRGDHQTDRAPHRDPRSIASLSGS